MKFKTLVLIVCVLVVVQSCNHNLDPTTERPLQVLWNTPIYLVEGPTQPLLMDKSSLVVSGDYNLTSLSTEDGSINWASEIDGISGLLNQEVLYSSTQNWIISTHFEDVLVWNSITGELQYHLGEKQGIVVHELGYPALTNNGYAFIGDTVNAYVLDWSGEVKFSINIEPWVSRSIAFQNETLFLGSRDNIHGGLTLGNITAFDSETGDSLWQYNTQNGGFSYTSDLVIENNMIYGGTIGNSPNSELVALDAATGVVIWKQTDYVWAQNLSLGSQHVYVNTGGSLVAFDKGSGSFQWRVEWSSFDNYKPVYLEGYVYRIGTSELLIIDDATGEVVHREPVPDGNGYFWNVSAGTDKIFVQTNVAVIAYEPWHLRGD